MGLQDEIELNGLGKYFGGNNAPAGTFINMRTMAYFQQGSDAALPSDGNMWILISTDNTKTASQIATILNGMIGGAAYTSASLHSRTSADNETANTFGTGANDA